MSKPSNTYLLIHLVVDVSSNPKAYFGDLNVIVFGDFYRLKPVLGSFVLNGGTDTDFHLWQSLFEPKFLSANHRQFGDVLNTDILKNIRIGTVSDENIALLNTRVLDEETLNRDSRLLLGSIQPRNNALNTITAVCKKY